MPDQNFFDKLIDAVYSGLHRRQSLEKVSRITTKMMNLSPILLMILGAESERKHFKNAVDLYLEGKIECVKMIKLINLPIISSETRDNIITFLSRKVISEFEEKDVFNDSKFEPFYSAIRFYKPIANIVRTNNQFLNKILIEVPTIIYNFIIENGNKYEKYFCQAFFTKPFMIFEFLYIIEDKVGCFEKIIDLFEKKIQEDILYNNSLTHVMNQLANCSIFKIEKGID